MSSSVPSAVLIVNTNDDTVEMLRVVLEKDGFIVISAFADEVRRGETDLAPLVQAHQPRCVVYDVALPYDVQWNFMKHLRSQPMLKNIPFVLTTTNVRRVQEMVPEAGDEVIEIVGKPYDLQQVVDAVRKAVKR